MYQTNYGNIEKVMLMKYNFSLSLRLALRNGFLDEDPELTAELKTIYKTCPDLFSRALSHADKNDLHSMFVEDEFELEGFGVNSPHGRLSAVSAINKIEQKNVKKFPPSPLNNNKPLPDRNSRMTPAMRQLLRKSYHLDYATQPPLIFDNKPIEYSYKIALTMK